MSEGTDLPGSAALLIVCWILYEHMASLIFLLKHHAVKASHYKTHYIYYILEVEIFFPICFYQMLLFLLSMSVAIVAAVRQS